MTRFGRSGGVTARKGTRRARRSRPRPVHRHRLCDDTCAFATSPAKDPRPMFERLFGNTAVDPAIAERIPPGQYRTEKFPVLHYGSVPHVDLATWDFRVFGEVDAPFTLTWEQFKELPRKQVHTDIHCVTRWSKLDTDWEGVPIQAILELAQVRPIGDARRQPRRAGLHRQPAARRPRRRRRPPGRHLRRPAARTRARLPAPPGRPEEVLLEELEVDPRPRVPRPRPARLLGALRLQQRRRSLEGRALQRRLSAPIRPGRQRRM